MQYGWCRFIKKCACGRWYSADKEKFYPMKFFPGGQDVPSAGYRAVKSYGPYCRHTYGQQSRADNRICDCSVHYCCPGRVFLRRVCVGALEKRRCGYQRAFSLRRCAAMESFTICFCVFSRLPNTVTFTYRLGLALISASNALSDDDAVTRLSYIFSSANSLPIEPSPAFIRLVMSLKSLSARLRLVMLCDIS